MKLAEKRAKLDKGEPSTKPARETFGHERRLNFGYFGIANTRRFIFIRLNMCSH